MESILTEEEVQDSTSIEVQLLIEPLINDEAKQLLDLIVDGKLYSSNFSKIVKNVNITKKNTQLFCTNSQSTETDNIIHSSGDSKLKTLQINNNIDFDLNNISFSENIYSANTEGVFLLIDKEPKVIPLCFDTLFEVRKSDDSVTLLMNLFPPSENQVMPKLEEILEEISSFGKIQNIDKEVINNSLNVVLQNKEPLTDVIISMGDLPVDGKDAWLEILAKTEQKSDNEKKNNVFANQDISYLSVSKDQLIANIHKTTEGFDGEDIFGNIIKHTKAKDIKVKLTSNIYSNEENNNLIYSKVDGFLEVYDNTIYVKELLEIKSNVDVNTGNIKAYGSLMVFGNVVNDMKLNLSQNLEINGYVGDAEIEGGKNVIIKGGFLGSGNGITKSGGDVKLKFIENQKVYSRGSLNISNEAINSELYVRDKIFSEGPKFKIIGGYAIASESIELFSAGNEYNTNTILEVGIDYQKKFSLRDFTNKLLILKKEIVQVDKEIVEISRMRKKSPKQCESIKLLANKHNEIFSEMELLKEKRNAINSEINSPTSSKIIIKETVYPGVKIIINGKQKIISEKLKSKTFILSKDDEIITL